MPSRPNRLRRRTGEVHSIGIQHGLDQITAAITAAPCPCPQEVGEPCEYYFKKRWIRCKLLKPVDSRGFVVVQCIDFHDQEDEVPASQVLQGHVQYDKRRLRERLIRERFVAQRGRQPHAHELERMITKVNRHVQAKVTGEKTAAVLPPMRMASVVGNVPKHHLRAMAHHFRQTCGRYPTKEELATLHTEVVHKAEATRRIAKAREEFLARISVLRGRPPTEGEVARVDRELQRKQAAADKKRVEKSLAWKVANKQIARGLKHAAALKDRIVRDVKERPRRLLRQSLEQQSAIVVAEEDTPSSPLPPTLSPAPSRLRGRDRDQPEPAKPVMSVSTAVRRAEDDFEAAKAAQHQKLRGLRKSLIDEHAAAHQAHLEVMKEFRKKHEALGLGHLHTEADERWRLAVDTELVQLHVHHMLDALHGRRQAQEEERHKMADERWKLAVDAEHAQMQVHRMLDVVRRRKQEAEAVRQGGGEADDAAALEQHEKEAAMHAVDTELSVNAVLVGEGGDGDALVVPPPRRRRCRQRRTTVTKDAATASAARALRWGVASAATTMSTPHHFVQVQRRRAVTVSDRRRVRPKEGQGQRLRATQSQLVEQNAPDQRRQRASLSMPTVKPQETLNWGQRRRRQQPRRQNGVHIRFRHGTAGGSNPPSTAEEEESERTNILADLAWIKTRLMQQGLKTSPMPPLPPSAPLPDEHERGGGSGSTARDEDDDVQMMLEGSIAELAEAMERDFVGREARVIQRKYRKRTLHRKKTTVATKIQAAFRGKQERRKMWAHAVRRARGVDEYGGSLKECYEDICGKDKDETPSSSASSPFSSFGTTRTLDRQRQKKRTTPRMSVRTATRARATPTSPDATSRVGEAGSTTTVHVGTPDKALSAPKLTPRRRQYLHDDGRNLFAGFVFMHEDGDLTMSRHYTAKLRKKKMDMQGGLAEMEMDTDASRTGDNRDGLRVRRLPSARTIKADVDQLTMRRDRARRRMTQDRGIKLMSPTVGLAPAKAAPARDVVGPGTSHTVLLPQRKRERGHRIGKGGRRRRRKQGGRETAAQTQTSGRGSVGHRPSATNMIGRRGKKDHRLRMRVANVADAGKEDLVDKKMVGKEVLLALPGFRPNGKRKDNKGRKSRQGATRTRRKTNESSRLLGTPVTAFFGRHGWLVGIVTGVASVDKSIRREQAQPERAFTVSFALDGETSAGGGGGSGSSSRIVKTMTKSEVRQAMEVWATKSAVRERGSTVERRALSNIA